MLSAIVRGNIAKMHADDLVIHAKPMPVVGSGVDAGIHAKAGHKLLQARQRKDHIPEENAVLTGGYNLPAQCMICAVCPERRGGNAGEVALLRRAFAISLRLNLNEARYLLEHAGFTFAPADITDRIVMFCIENQIYDIYEVNAILFDRDALLLGSVRVRDGDLAEEDKR